MANFGGTFGSISNVGISSGASNVNEVTANLHNYPTASSRAGLNFVITTTQAQAESQRYITIQARPFILQTSNKNAYEYTKKTHYFKYQVNNGTVQQITTRSGYDFSASSSLNTYFYLRMNVNAVFYDSTGATYPEYIQFNVPYNDDGTPQNTKIGFYATFSTTSYFGGFCVGSAMGTGFNPVDITSKLPTISPLSKIKINGTMVTGIQLNGHNVKVMLNGKTLL